MKNPVRLLRADPVSPPLPLVRELSRLEQLREPQAVMDDLRAIDWAFAGDDTGYLNHDFHPYPAKFIPQIPANLINRLSLRGELVWDPFGGSGTTALEALLLGRRALSTDLSPLATLIAQVKTTALAPEELDELWALRDRLATLAESPSLPAFLDGRQLGNYVPAIPNIDKWFSAEVTEELAYLKQAFDTLRSPEARRFALVAMSAIVVPVSNQDSETRYSARSKRLGRGEVLRVFCRGLADALNAHEPLERLLGYRRAEAATLDARAAAAQQELRDGVDLVVTSPPYANATDYHLYHRFRLFWMGFDPRLVGDAEIGSHLRHQREKRGFDLYAAEMRDALKAIRMRLRPGRYAALVVGDSLFEGTHIKTAEQMTGIADEVGLEPVGAIPRLIHATRRSFIPAARRARSEDIVVLRRPAARVLIDFKPPPYRMWKYEQDLRQREIKATFAGAVTANGDAISARLDPYVMDRARRLVFTHDFETRDGGESWRTWQAVLENGDAASARKDPKYVTHGLHPYKGKFYPQLAKALLNIAQVPHTATILDPFCGSGTVLLEAQLNGYEAVGFDMNPLAVLISRAKTSVAIESTVVVDRTVKDFLDQLSKDGSSKESLSHFDPEVLDEVESWFAPRVAQKIGWILSLIAHVPSETGRLVLKTLLSSIVRGVSQQEPADLRIRRRKQPLKDAPVIEGFLAKAGDFRERLRHFGERMPWSPVRFGPVRVIEGDARKPLTYAPVRDGGVDCVITSPPYATALPYIDTDRLSLMAILGIASPSRATLEHDLTGSREIAQTERRVLEMSLEGDELAAHVGSSTAAEIIQKVAKLNSGARATGFRRRNMAALLIRYFHDMKSVFAQLDSVLRPGAPAFFVIGDNRTTAGGKEVQIRSGTALAEMGEEMGWRLEDRIPISVTKEGLLHAKNSITENEILCFRVSRGR